jgi:hypothetical protein
MIFFSWHFPHLRLGCCCFLTLPWSLWELRPSPCLLFLSDATIYYKGTEFGESQKDYSLASK